MSLLSREPFPARVTQTRPGRRGRRDVKHIIAGFGDGVGWPRVKECEKHREGEKKLEVTASKAMRTSVLKTQGIKFVNNMNYRREWQPTPVPREFHRHRSLAGYSPWGHKESDMTKQLTLLPT